MSTATIAVEAGDNVRLLNKSRMADRLAGKPQAIAADLKAAAVWAPKKGLAGIKAALNALHVPQFARFIADWTRRGVNLLGPKALAVEVLTSTWGQKSVGAVIKTGAWAVRTAVKISWGVVSWPFRQFKVTRSAVNKIESSVATANAKLTPGSGKAFGPLNAARDLAIVVTHPDNTHMKVIRTGAGIAMLRNVIRRFVPAGPWRVAAYAIEGLLALSALRSDLEETRLSKKIWNRAVTTDAANAVVEGAMTLTKEAAAETAAEKRAQADRAEHVAKRNAERMVHVGSQDAARLREEASRLESTVEKMDAAETAVAVMEHEEQITEVATPQVGDVIGTVAPKPGPTMPTPPKHAQGGGKNKPRH